VKPLGCTWVVGKVASKADRKEGPLAAYSVGMKAAM